MKRQAREKHRDVQAPGMGTVAMPTAQVVEGLGKACQVMQGIVQQHQEIIRGSAVSGHQMQDTVQQQAELITQLQQHVEELQEKISRIHFHIFRYQIKWYA